LLWLRTPSRRSTVHAFQTGPVAHHVKAVTVGAGVACEPLRNRIKNLGVALAQRA